MLAGGSVSQHTTERFSRCHYDMPRKSLVTIYKRFVKESEALLRSFEAYPHQTTCIACHRLAREMCVVRLHDAWARACEELVLMSACDQPASATGGAIPRSQNVTCRNDVLPFLRSTFKGRSKKPPWWRPDWGKAYSLLDLAQRLGLSNYASLSLGMSLTPNPESDLRALRHFFAHRNVDTAKSVQAIARSYALPTSYTPEQVISSLIPPGITLFEIWVHDLRTVLRTAVA